MKYEMDIIGMMTVILLWVESRNKEGLEELWQPGIAIRVLLIHFKAPCFRPELLNEDRKKTLYFKRIKAVYQELIEFLGSEEWDFDKWDYAELS